MESKYLPCQTCRATSLAFRCSLLVSWTWMGSTNKLRPISEECQCSSKMCLKTPRIRVSSDKCKIPTQCKCNNKCLAKSVSNTNNLNTLTTICLKISSTNFTKSLITTSMTRSTKFSSNLIPQKRRETTFLGNCKKCVKIYSKVMTKISLKMPSRSPVSLLQQHLKSRLSQMKRKSFQKLSNLDPLSQDWLSNQVIWIWQSRICSYLIVKKW